VSVARLAAVALASVLLLGVLGPVAAAQEVVPPVVARQPTAAPPEGPSPGGAFLRAVLLPGWGHAAIGSYTRAGFYFAAETATAYALVRTILRLSEAREYAAFRERLVRSRLAAEGVTDAGELQLRLEEDPALADIRRLVAAREEQREDWIALSIFVVLLSGVDAYVSAHLADFPAPITLDVEPGPTGGVEAALRLGVGP
jgi:hypothetical protein